MPKGYESTYPYSPTGKMPGPEESDIPDPLIWLTYVAAHTTTIRLAAGDDGTVVFRELARKVTSSGAGAMVFFGGPARAARLARALDAAGYSGARVATQRALDPGFHGDGLRRPRGLLLDQAVQQG